MQFDVFMDFTFRRSTLRPKVFIALHLHFLHTSRAIYVLSQRVLVADRARALAKYSFCAMQYFNRVRLSLCIPLRRSLISLPCFVSAR